MYNKYPYTDFSELNLDWFLEQFKTLKEEWQSTEEQWAVMQQNFQTLEGTVQTFTTFVENYFENLDVQQEINNKLDQMALDGTLATLLAPLVDDKLPDVVDTKLPAELATQLPAEVTSQLPGVVADQIDAAVAPGIPGAVTDWLDDNVNPVGSAVTIDSSLTISGSAADAKVTGDRLLNLSINEQSKENRFGTSAPNANVVEHTGKLYNVNTGNEYSTSGGIYSVLTGITEGDILLVEGFVYNASNYPLYTFFDSSDNIIVKFGEYAKGYRDYLVTVPANAVKIIVQGSTQSTRVRAKIEDFTPASLRGYINDENDAQNYDLMNYILTSKEKTFGEAQADPNVVSHSGVLYNITTGQDHSESNGNYCVLENLTAGTLLLISGYVYHADRYPLYTFFDSNGNVVYHFGLYQKTYKDLLICVPESVSKIIVQGSATLGRANSSIQSYNVMDLKSYIDTISVPNIWKNKTIGVLGTSVAYGALATTSYPYEAAELLGYNLKMFATPGLAIQLDSDGKPINQSEEPNKSGGSFTATLAEYASNGWTIPASPLPYTPGGTYNFYYKSYENVFVADNADVDLWVYAVIPNNVDFGLDDWNAFDKTEWKYSDDSPFSDHRKTFLGALLFIMDQMYTLNPEARMVFVVDSSFAYGNGLTALETLCNQYKIPIINLWKKINTTPPSLAKIKSNNGTNNHPSTFAHKIMGKMLAGELGLVN